MTPLRRFFLRLPIWIYRAGLGGVFGTRFVLVNHTGRVSGRPRQAVLETAGYHRDSGAVDVVAGFGRASDWYRNLLAHPAATIRLGSRTLAVEARPLSAEESADLLAGYARRHPRAARRLAAYLGYPADGSEASYRQAGRDLPAMRLTPR